MSIYIELDILMLRKKVKSKDLAKKIGITEQNLSILKTGKAKAIRLSTLDAICEALDCTPGDILKFESAKKSESVISHSELLSEA
jgi:putative transcriptional regulator